MGVLFSYCSSRQVNYKDKIEEASKIDKERVPTLEHSSSEPEELSRFIFNPDTNRWTTTTIPLIEKRDCVD